MRRLAILVGLGLAISSCKPSSSSSSSLSSAAPSAVVDAGAVVPAASPIRYVHASTLKLREAPSATATVRGRVDINSPLRVLEARDGFSRVRVANGKEGWVGSELLGVEALTIEDASARAVSSSTPSEKLTWWQRAAAMAPTDVKVLGELKAAYLAVDNPRGAGIVDQLLLALNVNVEALRLHAVVGDGIEWQERSGAYDDDLKDPPRAAWAGLGLDPVELWTLPATTAAVRVEPRAVKASVWNECGGTQGFAVEVDRPAGDLLAIAGPPPASWLKPPPPPWPADRFDATVKQIEQRFCGKKQKQKQCGASGASAVGHGAVFVVTDVTSPDSDMDHIRWTTRDVRVEEDGTIAASEPVASEGISMFVDEPAFIRDVVGDATPEVITKDGCSTTVRTLGGSTLFTSSFRCCGC